MSPSYKKLVMSITGMIKRGIMPKKEYTLKVRITLEMKEELDRYTETTGINASELVRYLLKKALTSFREKA